MKTCFLKLAWVYISLLLMAVIAGCVTNDPLNLKLYRSKLSSADEETRISTARELAEHDEKGRPILESLFIGKTEDQIIAEFPGVFQRLPSNMLIDLPYCAVFGNRTSFEEECYGFASPSIALSNRHKQPDGWHIYNKSMAIYFTYAKRRVKYVLVGMRDDFLFTDNDN